VIRRTPRAIVIFYGLCFCGGVAFIVLPLLVLFVIHEYRLILAFLAGCLIYQAAKIICIKLVTRIKWAIWRHRIHRS
jgi:hypothetical protein